MTDLSSSAASGADRRLSGDPPIADITARPPATGAATNDNPILSDTLAGALKEAKAMFDARAKILTEQARTTFATLKTEADKRRAQGLEVVRDQPYAAVGGALLVGFLLGHLISAGRPQVVYLKDRR